MGSNIQLTVLPLLGSVGNLDCIHSIFFEFMETFRKSRSNFRDIEFISLGTSSLEKSRGRIRTITNNYNHTKVKVSITKVIPKSPKKVTSSSHQLTTVPLAADNVVLKKSWYTRDVFVAGQTSDYSLEYSFSRRKWSERRKKEIYCQDRTYTW